MKKIYIALAVLAAASLTSCVQEQSFNDNVLGDNEVAFVLQAGASTKVVEAGSPVRKGRNIKLGQVGNHSIYLEETITDLGYINPETKGTPVYTENVGSLYLYKDNLGVYATKGFGEAIFETMDSGMNNGGWRFKHRYEGVSWPTGDDDEVEFYLRMPADGVTIPATGYSDGKITFSYTSPEIAEDQDDLIFAYASLDEATHNASLRTGGYPVIFYHALTAVKFAIGNTADELDDKDIAITGVTFTNMVNTGTCTVDPLAEGDNPKVSWSSTSAVPDNVIAQDFDASDNVRDFVQGSDGNNFADSFYAAGNNQNVNAADASKTFWLIPQTFPDDSNAVMRISYTINDHAEYLDISLKDYFGSITWQAGQLRTFTIKLDEVNVKISDKVTPGANATAENGYTGTYKDNVKIQNTGDTPVFIRAAIVGQWLDPDGNPVFGFTDKVNNLYLVESWYEDQFVSETFNAETSHGKFYDLPGYKGAATFKADGGSDATAGWQLCTDGYYYYTKMVDPDDYTGSDLFTKYETLKAPKAELAGKVLETAQMHFVLEISTQAITAVKMDGYEGHRYTWKEAWYNATGITPVEK